MIDAGTISATLELNISPFSVGIGLAKGLIGSLTSLGEGEGARLGGMSQTLGRLSGAAIPAFSAAWLLASAGVKAAGAIIGSGADAAAADTGKARGAIENSCLGITGAFSGSASGCIGAAGLIASGVPQRLRAAIDESRSAMLAVGDGMLKGLEAKRAAVLSKAASIAAGVTKSIKRVLGIASPSRVMAEVGRNTAEGLILGISQREDSVRREFASLAKAGTGELRVNMRAPAADAFVEPSQGRAAAGAQPTANISALEHKLDRIILALEQSEQSLTLEEREFGRIIRKYI